MFPKDDAMTKPHDQSRPHRVILDATGAEAAASPQPEQQLSSVQGPFEPNGFFAPFPDPIAPGWDLGVEIVFPPASEGQEVQSVTAFVTELSPPHTPWQGDAVFLTNYVRFDQQHQTLGVGFSYEWDSPLHVGVMLTAASPIPIANCLGPFKVNDWLFCSAQPDEWAQPGLNSLTIDLSLLGIEPWTVSASVTELIGPRTPWQGTANFRTLGVQLNQPDRLATVFCDQDGPAALPVAVMMTIGYT
jgi:hypothetical protein